MAAKLDPQLEFARRGVAHLLFTAPHPTQGYPAADEPHPVTLLADLAARPEALPAILAGVAAVLRSEAQALAAAMGVRRVARRAGCPAPPWEPAWCDEAVHARRWRWLRHAAEACGALGAAYAHAQAPAKPREGAARDAAVARALADSRRAFDAATAPIVHTCACGVDFSAGELAARHADTRQQRGHCTCGLPVPREAA